MWRKLRSRSRSPPRLTSSIPQMEHHLAAMDSLGGGNPPVEKISHSAATSRHLPAASNNGQDHVEKQAAGPAQEALTNLFDKGQVSSSVHATEKSDGPKPTTDALICVKAQCSRPRLLTLIVCVSGLLFQLLGVGLGLRLLNGYTEPRLYRAEFQLQAAVSDLVREQVIHSKLDKLLGITLDRPYVESYEHCLARALYTADTTFLGIDFTQFPDVRNQTVDWATDSCDRLFYSPQLHTPTAFRLWTTTTDFRRAAENTVGLFMNKVALLRKWLGIEPPLAVKPVVVQADSTTAKRSGVPTEMPFGFELDCAASHRCHLFYSGPSGLATDRKTVDEAVAKASREVLKWSWNFEDAFRINGCIISLLSLLQPLLMIIYWFAALLSQSGSLFKPSSKSSRLEQIWACDCDNGTHLKHYEKLVLGLFINTALYKLFHYQLEYFIYEFDCLLLPVGLGFCIFHTFVALGFLDPDPKANDTLRSFCRAAYELYRIVQGAEPLPEQTFKRQAHSVPKESTGNSDAKPASKIASRFISPLTPLSEDLQQERKAMHAEQGKELHNDLDPLYGYATETDSEYDSDEQAASYVDLTGGATPTVSEGEEEWSLVED